MSKKAYERYMSSDVWAQKRQQRLALDGYKCRTCRHDGSQWSLQVHHVYDGSNWFRYPKPLGQESVEDDLITLCRCCHEGVTNAVRDRRPSKTPELEAIEVSAKPVLRDKQHGIFPANNPIARRLPAFDAQRPNRRSAESLLESNESDFLKTSENRRRF